MLRYSFLLGLEIWETAATCVCLHKGSDINLAAVLVERMSCSPSSCVTAFAIRGQSFALMRLEQHNVLSSHNTLIAEVSIGARLSRPFLYDGMHFHFSAFVNLERLCKQSTSVCMTNPSRPALLRNGQLAHRQLLLLDRLLPCQRLLFLLPLLFPLTLCQSVCGCGDNVR
jgi:hypothetical protein